MNFLFRVKRRVFTDLDRKQDAWWIWSPTTALFFSVTSRYIELSLVTPEKKNTHTHTTSQMKAGDSCFHPTWACWIQVPVAIFFHFRFSLTITPAPSKGCQWNRPRDGEVTLFGNHLAPLWKCWQLSPSIFAQTNHWRTYMKLISGNLVRLVHVSTQPATSGPGCWQHWGAAGGHEKCQVLWGLGSGCRGMVSRTRSWASRRGGLARQVIFVECWGGKAFVCWEWKKNICAIWGDKETKRLLEKLWLVSEYSELSIDCAVLNNLTGSEISPYFVHALWAL